MQNLIIRFHICLAINELGPWVQNISEPLSKVDIQLVKLHLTLLDLLSHIMRPFVHLVHFEIALLNCLICLRQLGHEVLRLFLLFVLLSVHCLQQLIFLLVEMVLHVCSDFLILLHLLYYQLLLLSQKLLKLCMRLYVLRNTLIENLLNELELPHMGLKSGILDLV